MIRNLWLIMAAHCIFLNSSNSYYIYPYVKCVKIECLFISKVKQQKIRKCYCKIII